MADTHSSGIYAIVNRVNGRRYIGSAVKIQERWSGHRRTLRGNRHRNRHLQRAWDKYGESAFDFVILELVLPAFLLDIEQKYLNKNKGGYNIAKNAVGSWLGLHHTEESKKKNSLTNIARYKLIPKKPRKPRIYKPRKVEPSKPKIIRRGFRLSAETCAKISAAQKGRKHSLETRARISAANKGKKTQLSPEQLEKMLLKARLQKSEEHRKKISDSIKLHWQLRRDCSTQYFPFSFIKP